MAPRKASRGGAAARKPAKANGYRLPERLPAGLQLVDVSRREWRIGRSVGVGGFGEIYLADEDRDDGRPIADSAAFVAKIEPHSNGPLFAEMHCYHRVGGADAIADWTRRHKLARLGMSAFRGSGSVEHAGLKYRFMVMERFGSDLQKLLDANRGRFPGHTVLRIGIQVIDVLQYIHSREYIHADIKAQNLLVGFKKGCENQVYLVDFGLACRYSSSGQHYEYRPDKRKAHDGTIEFTSRDAHIGAHSRRGDMEILGYNMLQWLCGRLPWQDCLQRPEAVAAQKRSGMDDLQALLAACFPDGNRSVGTDAVERYLQLVAGLGFDSEPDYDAMRRTLRAGLTAAAASGPLRFSQAADSAASQRAGTKKSQHRRPRSHGRTARHSKAAVQSGSTRRNPTSSCPSDGQENRSVTDGARPRSVPRGRAPLRLVTDDNTPCGVLSDLYPSPPLISSPQLRSDGQLADFDWQKIDEALPKRRNNSGRSSAATTPSKDSADSSVSVVEEFGCMTAAMREVLAKRALKPPAVSAKRAERGKKRSHSRSRCRDSSRLGPAGGAVGVVNSNATPLTPAMLEVLALRHKKRLSAGISRRRRGGRSAPQVAAPSSPSASSDEDFEDSFHTPPTHVPVGGRAHTVASPLLLAQPPRRTRSGAAYSPQ